MISKPVRPVPALKSRLAASLLVVAVGAAWPRTVHALPDDPPILSGSVSADISKPPVGLYPNRDHPTYDDHPTAYSVELLYKDWQYPLGDPVPQVGLSSFQGNTGTTGGPTRFSVMFRVPGMKLLYGNPAGFWISEPYFRANQEITCGDATCSPDLNVTAYAKWGNVKGKVTLANGVQLPPTPNPFRVVADPADPVPPGAGSLFNPRTTFVDQNGNYTFAASVLVPDPPCTYPYQCFSIPYDVNNAWGLPVLGDGGVDGSESKLLYSNSWPGFQWKISLSSTKSQTVSVLGSLNAIVDFSLSLDEFFTAYDEQQENRPEDSCAVGDHPVSLITGNVFLDQTDVTLPGLRQDLVFTRSYNSMSGPVGSMGNGWNHVFETHLEVLSPYIFRLWRGNGGPRYFTDRDGNGVFKPFFQDDAPDTITRTASGFVRAFLSGESEEYGSDGRLLRLLDRTGRATVLTYNGLGQVVEVLSPDGRKLQLQYDFGALGRLVGPEGLIAEYTYRVRSNPLQQLRLLEQVRYADGTGYRFAYNDHNQLSTVSDLAGVVFDRHGYSGELAAWSELNGGRERHTYRFEEGKTTVTDARNSVSVYEWTQKPAGKFISKITGCTLCGSSQAGTQTFERDDQGRLIRYVDAENHATSYAYNGPNLTRVRNALDRETSYGDHDSFGRPGTISEPVWGTTTLTWAPEGIQSVQLPGGQTTVYTYQNGRLATVVTGAGTTYAYNVSALGELNSFTDGRGKTTTFAHDSMGRLKTITRPDQVTTTLIYDVRGRLTAILRPDGKQAKLDYDASGRLSGITDEAGRTRHYSYDDYDRPEALLDAMAGTTRVGYDLMSSPKSLTDANGQTTQFEYDEFGRLARMISPMGGIEAYEYYPSGRLKKRTDRRGIQTTYAYDAIGRLTSKTYTDGTPAMTLAYDDDARTVTMANGTDTLTLAFDPSGRLITESSALNSSTVTYSYNGDHQRETLRLNGTLVAQYGYVDGYLDSIAFGGRQFQLAYDDVGRRQRLTHPNGIQTTYTYHPTLPWLEEVQSTLGPAVVSGAAYTHDLVGNALTKALPDMTENYLYDASDRLAKVDRPGATPRSWRFGYDAVGNRTSEQAGGISRTFTYDARNRLLGIQGGGQLAISGTTSEPSVVTVQGQPARMRPGNVFQAEVQASGGPTTFTIDARDASGNVRANTYQVGSPATPATFAYDPNGNLTAKADSTGSWTYAWNAENQLTRVTKDAVEIARFRYDLSGRRVEQTAGGVTHSYSYDGLDILRETINDGSTTTTYRYIHGPGIDEPLARENLSTGALQYYHADGLGSIVKITDGAGAITLSHQYDAWGNLELAADQPGYAFTGREWDPETGLYYYRARYYDPKVGRFISEDPIGFFGGVNFYSYAGGGPTNFRDPFGLTITVTGYVSSDQATVVSLINTLATTTEFGRQSLAPLIADPNRNLTVTLGARTRYDPVTDTVYFNPNALIPLETGDGWQFGAPITNLAHELSHATAPQCSTYSEQRAVAVENTVRGEFGFPYRISYPVRGTNWTPNTPPPAWAVEWSKTAVAR